MPLLLRSENKKIDFFSNAKFPYMTTERLYSYNYGKYLWGGCFTQGSLLFWTKASYVPFWTIKCLYCLDQRRRKIDFFSNAKFPYMTTKRLYSCNYGKYLWGGCFTQGSLLFWTKASFVSFWTIKCLYCSDQREKNRFFFMVESFMACYFNYFHF